MDLTFVVEFDELDWKLGDADNTRDRRKDARLQEVPEIDQIAMPKFGLIIQVA
jgi:hypothetical protein